MRKLLGLALIMLFLSGCATTVKFDPVANRNIRTIGLIEVLSPPTYVVGQSETGTKIKNIFLSGVGQLLVEALPSARKEAEGILIREINDSGFNFGRQMTEELAKALRNANYEVVIVSPNEVNKNNADAYLMVGGNLYGVGYKYSNVSGAEVLPILAMEIRLTSSSPIGPSKGSPLYLSKMAYGEVCPVCDYTMKPSERYNFDLTKPENQPLIIEGLQAGIAAIAEKVAADLRK